jgi:hypothetical protein
MRGLIAERGGDKYFRILPDNSTADNCCGARVRFQHVSELSSGSCCGDLSFEGAYGWKGIDT